MEQLSLLTVLLCSVAAQEEIFTCGGFAKSVWPLDLKRIEVALYTEDDSLKYVTDVAPMNGYFMIPVYNKGSYVLKILPPAGWIFEPSSIKLSIDGVNDPCSRAEDMNFVFKGFLVNGKLRTANSAVGPSDVAVALFASNDPKAAAMQTTATKADGIFEFSGVPPGKYFVRTVDDQLCLLRESVEFAVESDKVVLSSDLEIAGYSLSGKVTSEGKPISGVAFFLYSSQDAKVGKCEKLDVKDVTALPAVADLKHVCSIRSDSSGAFSFACIPSGKYVLMPYFKSQGVLFDVVPKSFPVDIAHSPVHIKNDFQVKGFSVSGRVLSPNKESGIANVQIFLNGKQTAQTNAQGVYVIEQMSAGAYAIKASVEDIEFAELRVDVSPLNPAIPDIVAEKFNFCGHISIPNPPRSIPASTKRRILITEVASKEAFTITAAADGHFCRMIKPGSYEIVPQILPDERKAGLALKPSQKAVTVKDGPFKNVEFQQFLAKFKMEVECFDACGQHAIVLREGDVQLQRFVGASDTRRLVIDFAEMLPGTYTASIDDSGNGPICWENSKFEVKVDDASETLHSVFRQIGVRVQLHSSHSGNLKFQHNSNSIIKGEVNIKAGANGFCVPALGAYTFVVDSCHQFEPVAFDTANAASPVAISAVKHRVNGVVRSSEPADDVKVKITMDVDDFGLLGPLKTSTKAANGTKAWEYPFEFHSAANRLVSVEPLSAVFLFTPSVKKVQVEDDCVANVNFEGERGLFIDGSLSTALAGVSVSAKHKQDASVELFAESDASGKFRLGPLRKYDEWTLSAEMPGYVFKHNDAKLGQFTVHKLSELRIEVVNSESRPLENVLISLTGGSYRSNNRTFENGSIAFVGLSPGDYFLRPIMKEYNFDPQTKMVRVDEGKVVSVQLVGNRVAFSCFGRVRTLNGQPVSGGVVVEAVADNCDRLHEESAVEENGNYRLSGLKPNCQYRVTLKSSSALSAATAPKSYLFEVSDSDILSKDFIVLPEDNVVEVFGQIKTAQHEYLTTLKVSLVAEDNPDEVLHTFSLKGSVFYFPLLRKDDKMYVVKLESSLNPHQFIGGESQEKKFRATDNFIAVTFDFAPKKKPTQTDHSRGIIILPILLVVGLLLAYNHQQVLPIAERLLNKVQTYLEKKKVERDASVAFASAGGYHEQHSGQFGGEDDEYGLTKRKTKSRRI